MYKSIVKWRDLDDGHLYQPGEVFPHDGRDVSDGRISELSSAQNKAGFALIKAVADSNAETPIKEPKAAEKPVETSENEPVKAKRTVRKKKAE